MNNISQKTKHIQTIMIHLNLIKVKGLLKTQNKIMLEHKTMLYHQFLPPDLIPASKIILKQTETMGF